MKQWKDVSSYSQNDKSRIPKSFEIAFPYFQIIVTRHVHYEKDQWVMSSTFISGGRPRLLKSKELEEAKKEAIEIVRSFLKASLEELNDI